MDAGFDLMLFTSTTFYQALAAGLLIGIAAPLVGQHLVVRRLPMLAEALAHLALFGIALGLFWNHRQAGKLNVSPLVWGFFSTTAGAWLLERMRHQYFRSHPELSIPILLTAGMGLGAIFLASAGGNFSEQAGGYLFGSMATLMPHDVLLIALITLLTVFFCIFFAKELFALSFDEENAILTGVRRGIVHNLLLSITALVVTCASGVVGVLLVAALMIVPVAASLALGGSFRRVLLRSVLFSELSVLAGVTSALQFDLPPGGTVATAAIVLLLVVQGARKVKLWVGNLR